MFMDPEHIICELPTCGTQRTKASARSARSHVFDVIGLCSVPGIWTTRCAGFTQSGVCVKPEPRPVKEVGFSLVRPLLRDLSGIE